MSTEGTGVFEVSPAEKSTEKVGPEAKDKEEEFTEEELEDVEETPLERLVGLSEMFPDRFWDAGSRVAKFSYWLGTRTAWVLGTTAALVLLPPFIEQQRLEFEEMQNMQKKQMLFGQGATMPNQPLALPPTGGVPAPPRPM